MPNLYHINAPKKFILFSLLVQFLVISMVSFSAGESSASAANNSPIANSIKGPSPDAVPTISGSFLNSSQITINSSGSIPTPASPYPSAISVKGMYGEITSLTVVLNNVSHTHPDDIDILLVGPQGQTAVLMSDVGGSSVITNIDLTFNDTSPNALPAGGLLVSGTYQPTDVGTGDSWPSPAPGGPYGSNLSNFIGTNPNGIWKLFVVDDTLGNTGSIGGGWTININTGIPASQNTGLTIQDNTTASAYPTKLEFDGAAGTITDMTVTIYGFTHTFPDDVDILLVGPAGQKMILMSDAGSSTDVTGINLTFSDNASGSLPDTNQLTPGVFKPTNYANGPSDTWPAPAPAGPYSSTFAALAGTSPNGFWSLYIVDDAGTDSGSIAAWSLTIHSSGGLADSQPQCGTTVGKYVPDDYTCGGLRQISHHMIFTVPDVNGHKIFAISAGISSADIHLYSGLTLADGVGFYVSTMTCANGVQITMTGLGGSGFNLLGNNSMQNALMRGFPNVPTLRALFGPAKFKCTVVSKT